MTIMKVKIGDREYTLNNNSGKLDRAKRDAGQNATDEQILAHYDNLAGLVRDQDGNKIENGSFWEVERKRLLEFRNTTESEKRGDEIVKLSPEFYGVGINLKPLWRKIKSWF